MNKNMIVKYRIYLGNIQGMVLYDNYADAVKAADIRTRLAGRGVWIVKQVLVREP